LHPAAPCPHNPRKSHGSTLVVNWQIVPIERRHVAGFHKLLDAVARERRYLAFLEAPPVAETRRFVLKNLRSGAPQFVAVDEGRVVGWCDVTRKPREAMRHSGTLGMGVAATHRGRGVGAELLRTTLEAALARGLSRIELVVRIDNEPAIALYQRFGFEVEGRQRDALRVDGVPYDTLLMALLADQPGDTHGIARPGA
jgi:RimJ/RimL family protein N-acetyltransferase